MRIFTTSLILTALLGLTACEPSGPSADIGDKIDQVTEESLANEPAATVGDEPVQPEILATNDQAPEPAVIEEQKAALEHANQVASEEAEERLNEILEEALVEP
ncbi:hypothetical protein [Oceanisphaera sp. IT1-181]|uniref:hypothetical protein n=1 Tax=Oceanisphaera sp. IT1-181 TaxID=3081199 RepID=UPI0029CA0DCC|nr:hypothetical protein [Oceanisphaera sp. IT1-181]